MKFTAILRDFMWV